KNGHATRAASAVSGGDFWRPEALFAATLWPAKPAGNARGVCDRRARNPSVEETYARGDGRSRHRSARAPGDARILLRRLTADSREQSLRCFAAGARATSGPGSLRGQRARTLG